MHAFLGRFSTPPHFSFAVRDNESMAVRVAIILK